jgi:hypothetical protein
MEILPISFLTRKNENKVKNKILSDNKSFSKFNFLFVLFISIVLFSSSLISAESFGYDTNLPLGNSSSYFITNNYYNASGNSTQFVTAGDLITLKESWLNSLYYLNSNPQGFTNSINDSLNNDYTYKQGNTVYINMTSLDNRYMTGGFKSFYFTNHTSDVVGMYNTTLVLLDVHSSATLTNTANDGTNVLFQFLSEPEPDYVVASGTRNFHLIASVNSESTPIQLRGLIYITNLTGGNPILLRNSTLSIPLTTTKAEYILTSIGGVVLINTTQRILFQIVSEKAVGSDPDVTIYLEDDDLSRLDVPSPVGVTDISHLVPYTGALNNIDLNGKNFTTIGYGFFGFLGSIVNRINKLFVQDIDASGNMVINKSLNVTENVNILGNVSFKRPFGMFSSTEIQTIASINTPYPITFNWTEDSYEIYKSSDNANFSFGQTGEYLIELSAIMQTTTPGDRVEIWIQKNGQNIIRSNTVYDFKSNGANAVIAVPFIIEMNMTDKFRVMFAGSSTNIKMQYITNTSYSPETPSIIMTISKISEIN